MAEPAPKDWNEELHDAIRNQDWQSFHEALANGADVNARVGSNYTTAVHLVVSRANYEIIQTVLRAGGNPNAKTRKGVTPIYSTNSHLTPEITDLFLDWGADPSAPLLSGTGSVYAEQVLHEAVKKNRQEVAHALIKGGADPLAVNASNGKTPIDNIPDYAEEAYDFLRQAAHVPRVEVDESLTREDLLTPHPHSGLTPLDNPLTWRQWPRITEVLAAKGEAIGKDELFAENERGEPRLLVATDARMLRAVAEGLNAQGQSLSMEELEQAGITRRTQAGLGHVFRQLACESNIRQLGARPFMQSLRALPEEAKEDLPNKHQLVAFARSLSREAAIER